jgi:hypothetical protein
MDGVSTHRKNLVHSPKILFENGAQGCGKKLKKKKKIPKKKS